MHEGVVPQRKVRNIRPRKKRSAAPVLGLWLFLLCCCLLAAYFFINSPFFSLQNIEVSGNISLQPQEIIEFSGLERGENIFRLDAITAVNRIEMCPTVKTAGVRRRLPATIMFSIIERQPSALVVGQDGFIAIDIEAVYLEKVKDPQNWHLPLISGINVEQDARPGSDLATEGLNAALELTTMLDQKFLENVAEIMAPSSLSLSLKTMQGVEVRFGEPLDLERKIGVMQSLLMENGSIINSDTVEYIDLRYNTSPVIKRKELNSTE